MIGTVPGSLSISSLLTALVVAQAIALVILLIRLAPGRKRLPAVQPGSDVAHVPTVSVIVATLNEARRITRCLDGLSQQGSPLLEVLVVDSNSTDGTREQVHRMAERDERFRLLTDPPLPPDWVGKVWALQHGLQQARGAWILGIDADTIPKPGMIAGILHAMQRERFDAASFGPRFVGQSPAERWMQPAMLTSLVYRTGAAGAEPPAPDRLLANGQCFMARRDVLLEHGGYAVARTSFSDDVTLARHLAENGKRVGFLDGARIIDVHAYASAMEMWREWGRSFDLKDGTTFGRRWLDVLLVFLTMALPVPMLVFSALALGFSVHSYAAYPLPALFTALLGINALLLGVRVLMMFAIRGNYAELGWTFWISWLADVPASVRLMLSTARRPRAWRGRTYAVREG